MLLIIAIAVARDLWQLPSIQTFVAHYLGYTNLPVPYHGFPLWLRLMHFFNLFLDFPNNSRRDSDPRGPSAIILER
jgi:hypothetical protein